jgi:hypothetical protein
MANKFVSPVGKLAWSAITSTTLNLKQEEEWNCGFILPEADTQEIIGNLESCLRDFRANNPSFPRENTGLNFPFGPSMKKDEAGRKVAEPGMILFKLKRPALIYRKATQSRERNTGPLVFDSLGRPVKGLPVIGPGSLGKVIYDVYGYDKAGQRGVGMQLLGFQIVKLEVDTIELEAVEGGWVPEPEPNSLSALLNGNNAEGADEVPF